MNMAIKGKCRKVRQTQNKNRKKALPNLVSSYYHFSTNQKHEQQQNYALLLFHLLILPS